MNHDQKSGQAISNCEIFTLILADNSHLEKQQSVLFHALNHKTRPDQFQLARGPLKNLKSG